MVYYGVSDTANEGTWVCEGTGQTIATATGPGTGGPLFFHREPNNHGGNQNCGCGKRHMDYLLDDAECFSSFHFLCEKP